MDPVNRILGQREEVYRCGICGKTTKRLPPNITTNAYAFPAGAKYKDKGYYNVAIKLDCGHYLLDDKDRGVPDFVRTL